MAAISHYIKGELALGRRTLREVQLSAIASTRQVQRWRLLVLSAGMWVLLRVPRVATLAHLMHQRWHVKRPPAGAAGVRSSVATYQGQTG